MFASDLSFGTIYLVIWAAILIYKNLEYDKAAIFYIYSSQTSFVLF
jgi:hypothetical protein